MDAVPISLPYRRYAIGLLLSVNLLNYIDRQMLFAVFPLIKRSPSGLGCLHPVMEFQLESYSDCQSSMKL